MNSSRDRLVCGREEDLVSFLYRELNEIETRSFRAHMNECESCSAELSAFGDIRQSVITWRDEALGAMTAFDDARPAVVPVMARRSARSALREFFNLSPVWMKAAVGFASILFCIFAVLAVAGLRRSPSPVVAVAKPSAGEINAIVEQRVQEELNRLKAQSEVATMSTPQVQPVSTLSATNQRKRTTYRAQQNPRRPLTRVEREQLAADLRLIAGTNDLELELLGDTINQ